MAIGLALLMGFVFPQNFNSPYRATGFRDFWRRWHMTLSRFLRDYLYIPLGGNRKGTDPHLRQPDGDDDARRPLARRRLELRPLGRLPRDGLVGRARDSNGRLGRLPGWLRWFVIFNLVVFGWILFRSQDLDQFGDFVSALFTAGAGDALDAGRSCCAIAVVIGLQLLPERPIEGFELRIGRLQPAAARRRTRRRSS